jgi:inner membrane protein
MDSLTQIVLGAACGEAVAGKKIGNRAMLWGAVGGTIPDLDVFAAFFTDELTATAFHRGFMHSFLFAAMAPWVLAWFCRRLYSGTFYRRRGYKAFIGMTLLLLYFGAAAGVNVIPVLLGGSLNWILMLPSILLGIWLSYKLWENYYHPDIQAVDAPFSIWLQLFFWSIFTHPILDCFTSWGTQIWQPFADTRVQWNTVSVVDPIATIPFAICLLCAAFFKRHTQIRRGWNLAGLIWFCAYLSYTVWHKSIINNALEQSLQEKGISYQRYMNGPTIFNNIVWNGVAEGDTAYYIGLYGFNDRVPGYKHFSIIPKKHELLSHIDPNDRTIHFLQWFSDGYYNVIPLKGDTFQVNDLRFGILGDSLADNNYVFPFLLFKNPSGQWDIHQNNRSKEGMDKSKNAFGELWERVKGDR